MFARMFASVVKIPEFRSLILRIPLAVAVSVGKEAFLGSSLFLITPRSAQRRIASQLVERVEKSDGLKGVARRSRTDFLLDPPLVDAVLHKSHLKAQVEVVNKPVPKFQSLRKVVSCVHVKQRKRDGRRIEGLVSQIGHDDRIFAAGKKQNRSFDLGRHFAKDKDSLGF